MPTARRRRRPRTASPASTDLLGVAALAFLVRVVFCFAVYPHIVHDFSASDGYDEIALNLAQGKGYTLDAASAAAERLPLYPAFLALFFWLFGPVSLPWQLAQSALGAITCALVVATARRYARRRAALAAGVFCAVHPTLVLYAPRPYTETLYVFLLVLLIHEMATPHWRPSVAGLLFGLQLLVKSSSLLHVLVFMPDLCSRHLRRIGRALACAALVLLPWVGWNVLTTGQPNLSTATSGRALYHGLYVSRGAGWLTPSPPLPDAEVELASELLEQGISHDAPVTDRDRAAGKLARSWVWSHRLLFFRFWARNLVLTWYLGTSRLSMLLHLLLHGALLAVATMGARRLSTTSSTSRVAMNCPLIVLAYTAIHAAIQPGIRYILPAVPLAALLAAGVARHDAEGCDAV